MGDFSILKFICCFMDQSNRAVVPNLFIAMDCLAFENFAIDWSAFENIAIDRSAFENIAMDWSMFENFTVQRLIFLKFLRHVGLYC